MKKIKNKLNVLSILSLSLMTVALVVSVCLYFSKDRGERHVLYFQSLDDSKLYTEVRYISEYTKNQELSVSVKQFLEELLLGPVSHRFMDVYEPGTKLLSCYVENDTLYVNLSMDALFPSSTTSDFDMASELLVYNVEKNFREIKQVELFVEGNNIVVEFKHRKAF